VGEGSQFPEKIHWCSVNTSARGNCCRVSSTDVDPILRTIGGKRKRKKEDDVGKKKSWSAMIANAAVFVDEAELK